MQVREEEQSKLSAHIGIVYSKVVLQFRNGYPFFELVLNKLLALVSQSLAILHCHVLHNGLLQHTKLGKLSWSGCRTRCYTIGRVRLLWCTDSI